MKITGIIRICVCRLAVILLAASLLSITAVPALAAQPAKESGTKSSTQSSMKSGSQSEEKSTSDTSQAESLKLVKARDGKETIVYFESDPDWKIRYSEEITDELVDVEMIFFSAFPPQFTRHIKNCSEGMTVKVLDKLPKDAAARVEYSMAPLAPNMTLHFAHNTAFLSIEGSEKVISHHLDGLDYEAEKKWDEKLKPESIKLYERFQASLPKSGDIALGEALANFLRRNYLWIYLNCPNLCAILLEK
ncbi:MAG: hypothetical protein IJV26_01245 [Lachnospiraceae bacterium]|nr:hypothetical protein [Lachnospiraceae bacterium]